MKGTLGVGMHALLVMTAGVEASGVLDPTEAGRPFGLEAAPVELGPMRLAAGAKFVGAWVLRADDPDFGGLSGLVIEDQRMTAVSDRAHWVTARMVRDDRDLGFENARIAPITDSAGHALAKAAGDAEALALLNGRFYATFEQDHRIAEHVGRGAIRESMRIRAFEAMPSNGGLEGLATVDRVLIAIGEEEIAGPEGQTGFPVFVSDEEGRELAQTRLPARSRHSITGADAGPDRRLFTVQRHFTPLTGVSIRVVAYDLDGSPLLPVASSGREIAAFESDSGIDNMEAIAIAPGTDGSLSLWLLSDDNFNFIQRTLMVELRLAE